VLDDADVSREHAVLFYDGHTWKVRDLSSRNGTCVDGQRIDQVAVVQAGSVLSFGGAQNAWQLLDASAPEVRAVAQTSGRVVVAQAFGLCLPDPTTSLAFVRRHDGQWLVERDGAVKPVHDQQELPLGGEVWRLQLTLGEDSLLAPTAALVHARPSPRLGIALHFQVSNDEEHVELTVINGAEQHPLASRSHAYLLLLLARARLEDQRALQLSQAEHGWVETKQLADMLRTTSERVNVLIFRARKQLQELDAELASRLVERRPTRGLLRIGLGALSISLL
jgi:hypothetical protein